MLNEVLETNIQNKLHILSILYTKGVATPKELMTELNFSASSINITIGELNFELQGTAEVQKINSVFQLHSQNPNVSFMDLTHLIYKNSNVLQCLRFLLTNESNLSFTTFMDHMFLTKSNAYRIKQICSDYLHCIGLDLKKNQVVGDEYRIRFLIALLYYKYGIDCCGIDSYSIHIAREFILSTNQQINLRFLEHTTAEYGFFECLFILSWKRRKYPLSFPQPNIINPLKELFIYQEMSHQIRSFLEPKLQIKFQESDFDYFHLIYCATNSCVLADKWSAHDINHVHTLLSSNKQFTCLLSLFEKYFGERISESKELHSVLIYFYKKCIMDLQCITPDKHYYLTPSSHLETGAVRRRIVAILDEWKKEQHIHLPVGNGHISYLTSQMTIICKLAMTPVPVIVMSDLTAEVAVMRQYLARNYAARTITVSSALINAEDLSFLTTLHNSVLIVKKSLASYVNTFHLHSSNRIIPVNCDINPADQTNILNAIIECDENIFSDIWNASSN